VHVGRVGEDPREDDRVGVGVVELQLKYVTTLPCETIRSENNLKHVS